MGRVIDMPVVDQASHSIRSPHQQRVDAFMRLALQDVPGEPIMPKPSVRKLRAKLIFEEAMETINALGVQVLFGGSGQVSMAINDPNAPDPKDRVKPHRYEVVGRGDLIEIVDGCCDIKVVTTGTLTACGVSDQPVQFAVDANNLAKFGPGHQIREDGKLIKPPDHAPPDLLSLLRKMGGKDYNMSPVAGE